jgi:lysyl-tRNA synthetase class 2
MSPESLNKLSRLQILQDRAHMFAKARAFFAERSVCEVDCPILSASAPVDAHIDLIAAQPQGETRYLHSSPEYGMKRLLSEGFGDIYQISHVFRNEESSVKHNPEFTMAEWYRLGISFAGMMEETVDFIRLFLGELPYEIISYREAFQKFVGIDYLHASIDDLVLQLQKRGVEIYSGAIQEGKDAILNIALGVLVEPHLGQNKLSVLAYYPSSQAALAQTYWRDDEKASERFEIYHQGIELANGYHELSDAKEQRFRFEESNEERVRLGKTPLPIDENFLNALKKGLPDCCGVAVGFDRLMMLRNKVKQISDVISFGWDNA